MKPKFAYQNTSNSPIHRYQAMLAAVGSRSPAAKAAPHAAARARPRCLSCRSKATSAAPPASAAGTAGTYLIQTEIPNANPAAAKVGTKPSAPRRRSGGAILRSRTPAAVNGAKVTSVMVAMPPASRVEKAT